MKIDSERERVGEEGLAFLVLVGMRGNLEVIHNRVTEG